jgi:hypothetical protein
VVWKDSLATQFYLDGEKGRVASGVVSGRVLTRKLKAAAAAKTLSYLDSRWWNENNLLDGANGIAALTFCDVPIFPQ